MQIRRAAAAGVAAVLCAILLARNPPGELARRAAFLSRAAPIDLARRRLAGSGAAFDRPLFVLLESARRRLPPDARGVALYLPAPSEPALHLAAYDLAPVPVRLVLSPGDLPPGWMVLVRGDARPPGTHLFAELPGGALLSFGESRP